MTKNATDGFKEFINMFDAAKVSKMFDPQALMEQFGVMPGNLDPKETIEKAKGNFESMAKANEAAAASYRDLMEKQMQIFRDLTSEASEQMKTGTSQDATETYQQAVKRALEIMTDLSEATQKANEQAFDNIKTEVDKALKDMKG
ncbi:MAG: hypothetical protein DRQ98_13355 [Gammaproteobacteria bacterium]|nr:MAG: hypothetical protein DRQ98_13355 [Gammaproteobacteria bacterium]